MPDPIRTCILSRDEGPRDGLIRLALSPDGEVLPDVRAKAPGRGAWIGVDRATLAVAQGKGRLRGALARAFKNGAIVIPDDLPDRIAAGLARAFLDRLGLEAKGGRLLFGAERIEAAARAGQVEALLHAADAGTDGRRRRDQAWRVGRDAEGSDLRGLALPAPRATLGLALGREHVVHIALTDRAASVRVLHALDRWRRFIGPEQTTAPCAVGAHGASALPDADGQSGGPSDGKPVTEDSE